MSEENLEMIRRGYEAYERRDLDAMVADYAPDFEYIAAGAVPGRTGTYRGAEGYKNFLSWVDEDFSDVHLQIDALIDAGDLVVACVTLRGQGRQSGIPATFTFWQIWTCENGQVVRGQGFMSKAEALEAAGMSE